MTCKALHASTCRQNQASDVLRCSLAAPAAAPRITESHPAALFQNGLSQGSAQPNDVRRFGAWPRPLQALGCSHPHPATGPQRVQQAPHTFGPSFSLPACWTKPRSSGCSSSRCSSARSGRKILSSGWLSWLCGLCASRALSHFSEPSLLPSSQTRISSGVLLEARSSTAQGRKGHPFRQGIITEIIARPGPSKATRVGHGPWLAHRPSPTLLHSSPAASLRAVSVNVAASLNFPCPVELMCQL